MDTLREKVKNLPAHSGCYIFRNSNGEIIYIAKSKSLKNRIPQYFQCVDSKKGKYYMLAKEIADIEYILADSERDALILECQLVRKHYPRYNSQLKKAKNYSYIKISSDLEYPTISIVQSAPQDDGDYFGFFYNENEAYDTILLMNSIWNTPLCKKDNFPANHKVCLHYHLKQCCDPCMRRISAVEYAGRIKEIRKCLLGSSTQLLRKLNSMMINEANDMNYEKAAKYRDNLNGLALLQNKCKRLNTSFTNKIVFLFFCAFHEEAYSIFYIWDGITLHRADFTDMTQIQRDDIAKFLAEVKYLYHTAASKDIFDPYSIHQTIRSTISDGEFYTSCLMSIYADKYFLSLPKYTKTETAISKIEKSFYEFISIQNKISTSIIGEF